MTENAKAFLQLLAEDKTLRAEFEGAADADAAFEVARTRCDISKEELFDAIREITPSTSDAELDLDDLGAVAGGHGGFSDQLHIDWCFDVPEKRATEDTEILLPKLTMGTPTRLTMGNPIA